MKRMFFLLGAITCVALLSSDASAAPLFRDQMTDGNAWGKNESSSDNSATFAYDYSADGIPEAPRSQGGDTATSGLKLESNNTDFVDSAEHITVYPLNQSFTGKYQLKFDAWQNYSTFDRENDGGAGTTEFMGGGIGYDDVASSVGVVGHSLISTNEGGSGSDYRGFVGGTFVDNADMASGSRNATCCGTAGRYETLFPGGSGVPPLAQGQTGTPNENRPGSSAFQWFTHTISVDGNEVRHQMTNKNGVRRNILVYDTTVLLDGGSAVATDGNISLFYADFFSSVSPHKALTFGLVDNVTVGVPEPASILMLGLGGACLAMVRRRK